MGIPPEDEDAVSRAKRLDRAIASHSVTTEGLYQFPTPHESGAEAAADAADRHASPLEPARVLGMRPSTTVVHDVVNELTVGPERSELRFQMEHGLDARHAQILPN